MEHGKKKIFIEPELTKYEKRLDEITLCFYGNDKWDRVD